MSQVSWNVRDYLDHDRQRMTPAARDFLDEWLNGMEHALWSWRTRYLPPEFPFDFSLSSLDDLQGVALERYPEPASVTSPENADFTEGAVRYIGEVVVRNLPARWSYQDLGDEDAGIHNRVPVIRANVPQEFLDGFAPIFELQLLAEDREAGLLVDSPAPIVRARQAFREAFGERVV